MDVRINPDNKIFWENCEEKKLVFQKCKKCGKIRWPFSVACPECYTFEYEIFESKGKGKIYSFAVFHVPFHKEFKNKVPYAIGIVELEQGIKFQSIIIYNSKSKLRCEANVSLCWQPYENYYLPMFKIV